MYASLVEAPTEVIEALEKSLVVNAAVIGAQTNPEETRATWGQLPEHRIGKSLEQLSDER